MIQSLHDCLETCVPRGSRRLLKERRAEAGTGSRIHTFFLRRACKTVTLLMAKQTTAPSAAISRTAALR